MSRAIAMIRRQVARGMGEGAGTPFFSVGLPDAIAAGDAPIPLPDFFARPDLNRDQHEVGPGQSSRVGRTVMLNSASPGRFHDLSQLVDDGPGPRV